MSDWQSIVSHECLDILRDQKLVQLGHSTVVFADNHDLCRGVRVLDKFCK